MHCQGQSMQLFIHKQLINEQWPPPRYSLLAITRNNELNWTELKLLFDVWRLITLFDIHIVSFIEQHKFYFDTSSGKEVEN